MTRQIAWLLKPPPASVQPEDAGGGAVPGAGGVVEGTPDDVRGPLVPMPLAAAQARMVARPRKGRAQPPHPLPSPEALRRLPPFEQLPDEAIIWVTPDNLAGVMDEIRPLRVVGFDTESRPVFVRGQSQDGPHLVQLASHERAWLFSMLEPACVAAVGELLALPSLQKVGFGLAGDRSQLHARFGRLPVGLVDLDQTWRALGYRSSLGIRMAMAVTFGCYFEKSKAIGKSDWSRQPLTQAQCRYAAHDAWGAFRIYVALCEHGVKIQADPVRSTGRSGTVARTGMRRTAGQRGDA